MFDYYFENGEVNQERVSLSVENEHEIVAPNEGINQAECKYTYNLINRFSLP